MDRDEMSNLYRGPAIDVSYQVLIHLAKQFQSQMNRILVGSIIGRSSVEIANLVPIRLQTWPPQAILVSD
jgi:hypothetical protein